MFLPAHIAAADGTALVSLTEVVGAFSHALDTIWSIGTKATLEAYLSGRL